MSTSRTLRLTASFVAVAASLALAGSMTVSAAADANHLGTDHLAQAPARAAGLDAGGISQVTGAQFDIGAVVELRHTQAAQYAVDHALELTQIR